MKVRHTAPHWSEEEYIGVRVSGRQEGAVGGRKGYGSTSILIEFDSPAEWGRDRGIGYRAFDHSAEV